MKPTSLRTTHKVALLAAGLLAAGLAQAQSYQFIDLGPGYANGINDLNQIVGQSYLGATLWSGTSQIGLVGGIGGDATAINDAGQIVGNIVNHETPIAASWKNGQLSDLFSPGIASYAYGINASGQIVGSSSLGATLWNNSSAAAISLGGPSTSNISNAAVGINNAGAIVGTIYGSQSSSATVWQGSTTTTLPNLTPGSNVAAHGVAINNAGVVVGNTPTATSPGSYPVEWNGTTITKLSTFGGTQNTANAINDAGLIVGTSSDGNNYNDYAVMWKGTTIVNLNSFLTPAEVQAGWVLTDATGVNNNGWIIGEAFNTKTDTYNAFALETGSSVSPVPEAAGWQMLLAGLALIGGFAYVRSTPSRKHAPHGAGCA